MKARTAWPWISLLLIALAVLNPIGFDFLYLATFSGEELSRNIAGPIVLTAFAVLLVVALIEFAIRAILIRREQRQTLSAERASD
jgi:hypothetical protein